MNRTNLTIRKICVLGLGYIGLPTAAMFATHGLDVVGVDTNGKVVETLINGDTPIDEPGLRTLVRAALKSSNLRVAREPEPADAFVIAVPTPLMSVSAPWIANGDARRDGSGPYPKADLSHVISAAETIIGCLRAGNLIVLESTVPPRTTFDVLAPILRRSGLQLAGDQLGSADDGRDSGGVQGPTTRINSEGRIFVAHCPERVLPGRILEELGRNDRVVGGMEPLAAEMARDLYASFAEGEIFLTDATTAELVKLMENTYRDVNIALANELAGVAQRLGVDVSEAIELANHHPRVSILKPGPGVGGHCIAVDPWFIVQSVPDMTSLIPSARRVNDTRPHQVVTSVKAALARRFAQDRAAQAETPRRVVACLGLAYKADVDDVRESPAIKVVQLLVANGFEVRAYDPHVRMGAVASQVSSLDTAIDGAQAVIVLTDHKEFRALSAEDLGASRGVAVLDTRNCLRKASRK